MPHRTIYSELSDPMHQQLQRNSMKKFLFSFLFFFAAPLLFAQIDMQPPELLDVPKFTLASFSYADDSTQRARVDVFLKLRYSALKFIKNADKFTSSYEVQISILSLEGELVTEDRKSVV